MGPNCNLWATTGQRNDHCSDSRLIWGHRLDPFGDLLGRKYIQIGTLGPPRISAMIIALIRVGSGNIALIPLVLFWEENGSKLAPLGHHVSAQ